MADFYVTLTPLEPYFFGSERKLGDGVGNRRSSYFIRSEMVPSQTTLMGMTRFFLLKQSKSLRNDYQIDAALIGKESFDMTRFLPSSRPGVDTSEKEETQDFGIIKHISPLFLSDEENNYYITTPKNHQVSQKIYTPYELCRMEADGRKDSYLITGYRGKDGMTQAYARLSDGRIFEQKEIFGQTVNVGIYKKEEKDAYFKKEYRYLKSSYRFSFFLSLDEKRDVFKGRLEHFMKENAAVKDIVYMGLGKSAFAIEVKRKENDFLKKAVNLIRKNEKLELLAYYTASDTLFLKNIPLSFAMIETGDFRYLKTGKGEYWDRMSASTLYQVVKPGSIFFLRKEDKEMFKKNCDLKNNQKIGMNQLIGSDDYE